MFEGRLVAICIAAAKCAPLRVVEEAEALPGQGLAGDRYCARQGTFSKDQISREELIQRMAGGRELEELTHELGTLTREDKRLAASQAHYCIS